MKAEMAAATKAVAKTEEVSAEETARLKAERKAKDEAEAAAAMNRAQKAAEEERIRMKEEGNAVVRVSAAAPEKPLEVVQAKEEAQAPAHASSPAAAEKQLEIVHTEPSLFREVLGYRVFKKNPQWCVEWAKDSSASWETFDKLDSDRLREQALELQKSVAS
jgi:pyruvate/2-oxoglutarate dehydrogenase complex dihydrolipoamide acyltransferase (E2) component